ncbi:MAG: hypothetical protein WCL39_03340, partial [Armatimonadota bacterium]
KLIASGKTKVAGTIRGRVSLLGNVPIAMPKTKTPMELQLEVEVPYTKTRLANTWNVWVYPPVELPKPKNVQIVKALNADVLDALANGARVLLLLEDKTRALGRDDQAFASVRARFRPQMWEWGHNLGAYVPAHPAFAGFPNTGFSDLQFYRAIDYGRKIILDDCPFAPLPIVDAIDIPTSGATYCRKATYLFEMAVGKGKLLVTGFNFTDDNLKHPEVRALYKSLVDYAAGPSFKPQDQVAVDQLHTYAVSKKANPRLSGEGYWDLIFYDDTELVGRNKFLDRGEEAPVVRATPSL